jgi:signal transduction histidine kinase
MRGTSLSMRFTLATVGMVLLCLFLANLVFQYAGKGRTDREFAFFAYQRAFWLAGELEARMPTDEMDRATREFLSRSAREMDLSIVLLFEADEPIATAHGPSLAAMLRTLEDNPDLGRRTDRGETPWEPAFDGSTDRARYPDRLDRPVRVQERWPYAVEAPVRTNLTLRILPLSQARLGDGAFGRGLVGVGMILLLASTLVGGRLVQPLASLASSVASAARGQEPGRIGPQAFDEARLIANGVNAMGDRVRRAEADRKALLSTVAGSFSGPVSRLSERSAALDLTAIPPRARGAVETMQADVAALQDVVDDMAHWSALEAGEVGLEVEEVDVRHLLEEVCADLGGDVTLDISDDVEELVRGDRAWLRALLRHVIENALEHGEAPVQVTGTRAHTKVEFAVRDHGAGLSDIDDLRRIFGAFFRAGDEGGERLGVGLAIAQHVIDLHRGGLRARNHPEGGLEIHLWLPAPPIRVSEPDRSIDVELWEREDDLPGPRAAGADPDPPAAPHAGAPPSPTKLVAEEPAGAGDDDPYAPF